MTNAEIIRRAPGRNVTRVARVAKNIPAEDKAAWLLVLRDWCRANQCLDIDYAVRVWDRHRKYEHATH